MPTASLHTSPPNLDRLRLRRQFILGMFQFKPNEFWNHVDILYGLTISIHCDLEYHTEVVDQTSLSIIGIAVNPYKVESSGVEVLRDLHGQTRDLATLLQATSTLAGRWVIIYQTLGRTYIVNDPAGLRQVYYYFDSNTFICGSQPEIISLIHALQYDISESMWRFLSNPQFTRLESAWIGSKTIYKGCKRLLPNHYLDANTNEQIRFFPSKPLATVSPTDVVDAAANILEGTMGALAARYQRISLALTAGYDSRVLLAASRAVAHKIDFFVDRMGALSYRHPDVRIPHSLASKLGLDFVVENSTAALPSWFLSVYSKNITMPRVLPKTAVIYRKLISQERGINVNGNVSEICRCYYKNNAKNPTQGLTARQMATLLGYEDDEFSISELDDWIDSVGTGALGGIDILDLLYWEQRLGNWGAQYPTEQDIAVDEFSPFNCRSLLETLLAAPEKMRMAPRHELYRDIIEKMWPETLSEPINPDSLAPIKFIYRLYKKW